MYKMVIINKNKVVEKLIKKWKSSDIIKILKVIKIREKKEKKEKKKK